MRIIRNNAAFFLENTPPLCTFLLASFHGRIVSTFDPLPKDKDNEVWIRIAIVVVAPLAYLILSTAAVIEMAILFLAEQLSGTLEFSEPILDEEGGQDIPNSQFLTIPIDLQDEIFQMLNVKDLFLLPCLSKNFRNTFFSRILSSYVNVKKIPFSKLRLNSLQKKTWLKQKGTEIRFLCIHKGTDLTNAQQLISHCSNLRQLDIHNHFRIHYKYHWVSSLIISGKFQQLSSLSLQGCNLQTSDAFAISSLATLKSLNLFGNHIGLEGAIQITTKLNELEILNLSAIGLKDDENMVLFDNLQNLEKLKELIFRGNKLGPKGGAYFAESLKGLKTLTKFNIGGNLIEEEGAIAIAKNLKNLTHLSISWNRISFTGLFQIINNLKKLTYLESKDGWAFTSFFGHPYLLTDITYDQGQQIINELLLLENLSTFYFPCYDLGFDSATFRNGLKLQLLEKFPNCLITLENLSPIA